MATINISPNKYLINLLSQMLIGLALLNKSDPALNQVTTKIKELMGTQKIDGHYLAELLTRAKDIVESYGISPNSKKSKDEQIANLPMIFYNVFEELDHLETTQRVMDKISGVSKRASIQKKLELYRRLTK